MDMREQHYAAPTKFIYFNHVFKSLSSSIMKINKFHETFNKGVLNYFKSVMNFLNISE